jgi:predicted component of type VI protein secretion system
MDESSEKGKGGTTLIVEIINGVYDGMRLDFSALPITIGRSAENDISIPFDTAASRSHAKIIRADKKGFIVIDLNSTNGTFVNYMAIKDQAEVKPGDTVKVGDTLMKCFLED